VRLYIIAGVNKQDRVNMVSLYYVINLIVSAKFTSSSNHFNSSLLIKYVFKFIVVWEKNNILFITKFAFCITGFYNELLSFCQSCLCTDLCVCAFSVFLFFFCF